MAQFSGAARFSGARFSGDARFDLAQFSRNAWFDRARRRTPARAALSAHRPPAMAWLAGRGAPGYVLQPRPTGRPLGPVVKFPSSARRAGFAASGACSRPAGRRPSYWLYVGLCPVRRVRAWRRGAGGNLTTGPSVTAHDRCVRGPRSAPSGGSRR
ncbi:pentapeptide repeat-containing protein [Streptomyces sp. NPDC050481]|uniref:pentapeptide repeat-containing protein n=1 Tax=Streptomyces sp. NPDC050481 TaxID=3365616 RepID=UPI00379ADEEE